ncbi:putative Ig domain-containing protein [Tropheryma whipplei]|uniref:putative Ig domain-containing protein n=1 Tax=Tropheryma whipplei TaxID=2039 RepID=UPI0009B86E73|nr:putative Ig domain-containing protein [Tropheryma whipplei]
MSYTVTNTTETSPTTNGGLPKGLTLDTTKGTITGSIDTGVTTGCYIQSNYYCNCTFLFFLCYNPY